MCIDTGISWVSGITIRTPNCFEMKHIEICVFDFYFVKQIDCELTLRMRKSAHVTVLALIDFIRVTLTKLYLILFRVIELFDAIMSAETVLSQGAV